MSSTDPKRMKNNFQIEDIAKIIPMLRVAKCKSSSKNQKTTITPQHLDDLCNILYLKIVFHAFGICRTHRVTNEYLLFENNLVELSGLPHEILSSI